MQKKTSRLQFYNENDEKHKTLLEILDEERNKNTKKIVGKVFFFFFE